MATPPPANTELPPPLVETFTLGPWMTNAYLVRPSGDTPEGGGRGEKGACWVVDPGLDPHLLIDRIRHLGLRLEAIVLTHAHLDHIAGVADVLRDFPGTPVWIHEAEAGWLNNPVLNGSEMMGVPVTAPGPDRTLRDGEELDLAGARWRVLHTPGHTPGGITLYSAAARLALVGDLIMAGSVGRFDFPGSSEQALVQSIRRRIYTLPDDVKLLSGHGPPTTVGRERRTNPFVRDE